MNAGLLKCLSVFVALSVPLQLAAQQEEKKGPPSLRSD